MHKGDRVHFIGIGGYGMGPLAKIMLDKGYKVSGSDMKASERTERMQKLGANVRIGHSPANLPEDTDFVVISAAVPDTNPELVRAKEKGISVYTHAEMVGQLMSDCTGIGISGAHGKTTTTSMVSVVLWRNNLSPTVLIGGEVDEFSGGGSLGESRYFVVEADEAYGRFLKMYPRIAAVTNIDDDHLDYYKSFTGVLDAFKTFISNLPSDGLAILNNDDKHVVELKSVCQSRVITYGIRNSADLMAKNINLKELGSTFDVWSSDSKLGSVELSIPGEHNVSNALIAVAIGIEVGIEFEAIAQALKSFKGAHRRFELHSFENDVMVIDDYAHHPTEIKAVLKAAKEGWNRRIIAIFQPQRFSRTQLLMDEFATAFSDADIVIIPDIYYEGTGEEPIPGITSERLAVLVKERSSDAGKPSEAKYIGHLEDVLKYLESICRRGDMVITMGAGNVWKVAVELSQLLASHVR